MRPRPARALAVAALLALAGCSTYQAPPVDHPALPPSFRNTAPWPTSPVATLPKRAAPPHRVVLLPEDGGKVGRVSVQAGGQVQEMAQAYAALDVDGKGGVKESRENEASVRNRYGSLLDARPKAPVSFLLYFKTGDKDPTEESVALIQRIKTEIDGRPAPEVLVIGHTDSVGNQESNRLLSSRRAEQVVDLLMAAGLRAKSIQAVGRGEIDPLVPTRDETPEPRNRRVEVSVR